jgi:hypothetical protein
MNILSHSHLGYRPSSPKQISLRAAGNDTSNLPNEVPFYVRHFFDRMQRDQPSPKDWNARYFRWPFEIAKGNLVLEGSRVLHTGTLRKVQSRWGAFWQGDFDSFSTPGLYQIESPAGCSYPFAIGERLYERLQRTFLNFLSCQRSGAEIPGVRPADHLDDGILDVSKEQILANGGWYDAGDLRKWLFLTQPNLATLAVIATQGLPALRQAAVDEILWGNRYFHAMIAPNGQVWEDLAGGEFKAGLDIEKDWWYENHPGCNCDNAGGRYTDNIAGSGDERVIRTRYNAAVQFMFVRTQAMVSHVLPPLEAARCRFLAAKAWRYGRNTGHDRRTLFVAEELLAAVEAQRAIPGLVSVAEIRALADELLERQDTGRGGLEGYFLERAGTDGFRCIALSCEAALALLTLAEADLAADLTSRCRDALSRHIDGYLLADARSNPFGLTPYGVFINPLRAEVQTFRDAGRGRFVRSFIPPFSPQQIVHGTLGVAMHQGLLLARAGRSLQRPDWSRASERLIHWMLGHNPDAVSLHTGIAYRHPTPFSAYVNLMPDAICAGHVGTPDDQPYQEMSPLLEWGTQEIWDIPHAYAAEASIWLG